MQEGGMEVQALQNRPKLTQWVIEYWEAFHILGSSRIAHQGGIGPIPLTEIVAYMDAIYLFDVDERLKLIKMIQSLDSVYMKHVNEKAAHKRELSSKQRKSAPIRPRKR
jgi:hypothetical protein